MWHPIHIQGPPLVNKASDARLFLSATCSQSITSYLYCYTRMPRYGAHIILPWMTGAGKAYSDEQHPPTVSVPHFDFLETYDCLFTDFIPDFITFADMNMTRVRGVHSSRFISY